MDILVWGINFKTAPVELREKLACGQEETPHILKLLASASGLKELMILSTCNRVELYMVGSAQDAKRAVEVYTDIKGADVGKNISFFLEKERAVAHIFMVASSLDSMVVGEPQIVRQFKDAYLLARQASTVGKILNRLYQHALKTAKRVRTETAIARNAVSVSYVAVDLARRIFGDLRKARVLLVGAGEMAQLAARYFRKMGASIFISNRTYEKAVDVAKSLDGNVIRFEELGEHLHTFDIVLVSTGSKDYVIRKDTIKNAIKRREYRPMFIIDISVPRNVDPEVNQLDEVFLYDIDDLRTVAESNLRDRLKEKEKGEIIVWDEVRKFMKWLDLLKLEDKIVKLLETWRDVAEREPKVRKLLHTVLEEIRKDPSSADRWFKILLQEEVLDYGNSFRRIPYVHNRTDGTGV
ncbi:glutamyl-tRNA reductase [Thermocrinis albus DSM 14484]|uniref:Glutamyl-tRNA reductase n=1 Tax=Thermocrinis albus (strain DSM 14484 / JCM 11386 / HI 11/12) TaxID=638303 RepID=D3SML0_THEAH|nr:glutamyl-tRNA reductase [Thermocrinis albus]ADC89990.1 glutamyl-tRNA reductase [Thermocrinis albus DSM 14484]